MELGDRFGVSNDPNPYHGRVFQLHELNDVITEFGLPAPDWNDGHEDRRTWPDDTYIEIQLWTDEPIVDFLTRR